jgi:hypothetical protein
MTTPTIIPADPNLITVLPPSGIITVSDLAKFLHTNPAAVRQALADHGVSIIKFSIRADRQLVRLEDLKK